LGVSQAVAFGLIAMVAMSTLASMALIYQKSQDVYDSALQTYHSAQILSDQTLIRVRNVSLSDSDLIVGITNNGSTNLYDYRHFSIIVDYSMSVNGTAVPSVQSYNYTTSIPAAGQWTSLNGILLPSELGRFEIALLQPVFPGSDVLIVITTNLGPGTEWRGVP
jgi:archaellum component FlaF (FlaF/FlaG flagellin family)